MKEFTMSITNSSRSGIIKVYLMSKDFTDKYECIAILKAYRLTLYMLLNMLSKAYNIRLDYTQFKSLEHNNEKIKIYQADGDNFIFVLKYYDYN